MAKKCHILERLIHKITCIDRQPIGILRILSKERILGIVSEVSAEEPRIYINATLFL